MRTPIACAVAASVALTAPLSAQYADAHVLPKGFLRIGFEPHYTSFDQRYALGSSLVPDDALEFLGADLTADTVGSNIFPAVATAEQAVRDLTGNQSYRLNIGSFTTVRDADLRRFPFSFSVGLTDRITVSARIPIVTHRSQITFSTDSTDANAGFSQAFQTIAASGNPAIIATFLSELTMAIADVRAGIMSGSFGCPGTQQCTDATASADRADALLAQLSILAGTTGDPAAAVFAPLSSSAEGAAISAEVSAVVAELGALGVTPVTGSFPLPMGPVTADDINLTLFADSALGYNAAPLDFIRGTGLGDLELGIRASVLQSENVRLVVRGDVRFPTSSFDDPDNFIDLGTGDAQLDYEGGFEAAILPRFPLSVNVAGAYTYQSGHTLNRRVGPTSAPILPIATTQRVTRNPGNILRLTAYPTLTLAPGFTVFGIVHYLSRAADVITAETQAASGLFPVSTLAEETEMMSMSYGAGIAFRSPYTPGGSNPIEAGVSYHTAFSGSGGQTPKANQLRLYLRLYRNIFAPPPPPPAAATTPSVP